MKPTLLLGPHANGLALRALTKDNLQAELEREHLGHVLAQNSAQ